MDFGTSIKSLVGIGSDKTNDSISEEPSDNTESGNDTSGKKTDISASVKWQKSTAQPYRHCGCMIQWDC